MGSMTLEEQLHTTQALMKQPESVLFVTSQLRPRELKMADGLRKLGWTVGLIYYKWTPFDPASFFDFAIEVASAEAAHTTARQMAPRVTHVFSGAIDDFVMLFCRDKPSPVVIDLNDVFAPSLFDYCHERFEPTREALALADGFCARDLQVKSAQKIDGFKLPKNLVLFPEYCWKTVTSDSQEKFSADEVHIVSVGTFSLETQGMYDSCYLQLARLLIAQQIHFHIYPHWAYRRDHMGSPHVNFEKDFADFLELERNSPYLHLHDSLPIDELAQVLPKFDFGIVSGGCEALGQKLKFYYPAYIETCYSGRISDYLEAGLPVLVNDEVKFDFWLLKRYGVCADLKGVLKPGFKQMLLGLKHDQDIRVAMSGAVQSLSVTANSPRLARFYLNLHAKAVSPGSKAGPSKDVDTWSVGASPRGLGMRTAKLIRRAIRWFSPRLSKILLPYRASRLFQVRLHNALLEIQSSQVVVDTLNRERDILEIRLAEMQQAKEGLMGQVSDLQQDCSGQLQRLVGVEEDKQVLIGQLADSDRENASLNAQLTHLGEKREIWHQKEVELAQDNAELHVRLIKLQEDSGVLNQKIAALDRENATAGFQVASLEQINITLSNRLDSLVHDKSEQIIQVADLRHDKQLQGNQIAALEQINIALSNRLDSLAHDKSEQIIQVADLRHDKQLQGNQIAALEQINIALSNRLDSLAHDKSEQIVQIADLRHDKELLGNQISALLQDKLLLGAQLQNLEQDKQVLHVQVSGLEQDKAFGRSQVATLEEEKTALRAQLSSLDHAIAVLRTQIELLEQDKAAFQAQMTSLQEDQVASRMRFANLEQEKLAQGLALTHEKELLVNGAVSLEQSNSALQAEKRQLDLDVGTLQGHVKTLETELHTLIQQADVWGREKLVLQQEMLWGKASIKEVAEALNWEEVLDDVERTNGFNELVRILGLFSGSTNIGDTASACWDALAAKNYDQLLNFGYSNFKRTIGNNYFNFLVQAGDPQIQAVEKLLSPDVLERARAIANSIPYDPQFPSADQLSYRYFVLLLWEYLKTIDVKGYGRIIKEPLDGNPILVPGEGGGLSQDLANSLIEYYSIDDVVSFKDINSVLEIGGGYGRNAFVILSLNSNVQVTLVDIPPALYIAERYLSSVFKERRIFKARQFEKYEEVKEELERASIVFLMPHQLTLMPAGKFDLGMNISSLHEMSTEQIAWYFGQLDRLTAKYFYHKQWRRSKNIFDGVVVNMLDYPYPENWQEIYSRPCSVQNEFFEALYQVTTK